MTRPATAIAAWLVTALLVATAACATTFDATEPLERFPRDTLAVVSGDTRHRFEVWIADTPARRTQGLMHVHSLDPGRGMLFVFDRPQYAAFWMRNTYVALDLLFIAADGRVLNIARDAVPLSTTPMQSDGPVTGVLEVLAGTTERLGIHTGDRIEHPAFRPAAPPR